MLSIFFKNTIDLIFFFNTIPIEQVNYIFFRKLKEWLKQRNK